MTELPDYYAILQVHTSAERAVIDAAYRRLAARHHPDVSQDRNATERMVELNAAYEVLSDPARRAAYDATRRQLPRGRGSSRGRRRQERVAFVESRHVTVEWLPSLALLALIVLAIRLLRLGGGETALVLVVSGALWLLARKR